MKALCVFSGGLDSMLAAHLIRAQNVDVLGLFFETPFFTAEKARASARSMGLPLKVVDIFERHLQVVRSPRRGYGGHMNPCIDCHTLMFRIAGEMLPSEQAKFIVTGEVLGQRPMSQNKQSLMLIARESGYDGLIVRPLSARCLLPTIPEQEGWIDREQLLDWQGRTRKPQMEMARQLQIKNYPSPAGGCLLTEEVFSRRLKDLFAAQEHVTRKDLELLKWGRHFRILPHARLVVGRNKKENEIIGSLAGESDILLTATTVPGPTGLLSGPQAEEALAQAASIILSYSDIRDQPTCPVRALKQKNTLLVHAQVQEKDDFRSQMI